MTTTKLLYLLALVVPGGLAVLGLMLAIRYLYLQRRPAAVAAPVRWPNRPF